VLHVFPSGSRPVSKKSHKDEIPLYVQKLLDQVRRGQLIPGVHEVRIVHQDGCALIDGRGPCDCDADVHVNLPGKN
jgi:hypothetical protein